VDDGLRPVPLLSKESAKYRTADMRSGTLKARLLPRLVRMTEHRIEMPGFGVSSIVVET
jgi:hypothetical protein